MNKYVYLFELDSVRNHNKEIEAGQKALYDEIVFNGNTVVLTFNQLVDSRGFFSLLDSENYYNSLLKLFESGAIQISQYGDIRTISQYLLTSFDQNKEFIYSGWPLKFSQRRLIALIKRSLMYSDLSEINGYLYNGDTPPIRTDEETIDLFVEIDADGHVTQSKESANDLREILVNLSWLLKTILRLSAIHTIYIPPRDPSEYNNLKLSDILSHVVSFDSPDNDPLWDRTIRLIKNLRSYTDRSDNRSSYVRDIRDIYTEHTTTMNGGECQPEIYQYAEAIIDLVYNYACEISICNISKHYDVAELSIPCDESAERPTFSADFHTKLKEYWDIGFQNERFLCEETNVFDKFEEFDDISIEKKIEEAVRLTEYGAKSEFEDDQAVYRYEYHLSEQQNNRSEELRRSIRKKFRVPLLSVLLILLIEIGIELLQNKIASGLISFVLSVILPVIGLGLIEYYTQKKHKTFQAIQPLSESIGDFVNLVHDHHRIRKPNTVLHKNSSAFAGNITEPSSTKTTIDFIKSTSLKHYIKMRKDKNIRNSLFAPSAEIPLVGDADLNNEKYLKELIRCEEMHDLHFGIHYKSNFNTLVVDPIISKDNSIKPFYPYERMIPTAGNGIVTIPMYKGKFILLRQFRHAPRKEQYCFPRGYGEVGLTPKENAKEELKQEINAIISKDPIFIGNISPDTGLTSSCASVYLTDVASYSMNKGHEGILEVVEVTEEEFDDMLQAGADDKIAASFDDGYTLAAYALYKRYCKNEIIQT